MLRPQADAGSHGTGSALAKQPLLLAVARRGLPGIVEASFVPAAIFLLARSFHGARFAMLAVLLWGCASFTWRRYRGTRPPTLVVIALGGLVLRTLIGVGSGSTLLYFLQPVATTVGIAAVLVGSVAFGRPLVARVAHDFCPIAPEVESRHEVKTLFAGLTMLWAAVQLASAAITVSLLMSLDTGWFVVVKPVASLTLSAIAVTITIVWALRVARRQELVFATS